MTTSKQTIIVAGAAILVVGAALTLGPVLNRTFEKTDDQGMANMAMDSKDGPLIQTGSSDYKTYAALTGDAYDSAFIKNMIVHHEGAVSMAQAALANAKRQEIKDMANNIIAAQSKEITEMKKWQQQWGYTDADHSTDASNMDHHAMGMDMMNMEDELKGKTGDQFDKAFLSQMIMHHQSAINMAAPGEKNAKHQEVKNLTKAVVSAQSQEIKQMRSWQKDWNF